MKNKTQLFKNNDQEVEGLNDLHISSVRYIVNASAVMHSRYAVSTKQRNYYANILTRRRKLSHSIYGSWTLE